MEITLEKIELVKDRTGVSYKEAKDALEAADGSVVDAIIAIEETVDEKSTNKAADAANDTVEKIKELVKKGNVARICVKKEDEIILNLPLNAGIVGTLVAPWGVIAGAIAAFGFKCKIEVVKDDGSVINVSQKAETIGKEVAEKSAVVMDDVVAKGSSVMDDMVVKGTEAYNNLKDVASSRINELKNRKDDFCGEVEAWVEGLEEEVEDIEDGFESKLDEVAEKLEKACEDIEEKIEEKIED